MDILGIGPVELLLIFVMALIIFGPGRLPELGVALARAIREFQRASSEVTTEINRQLEEAENRRILEQHPNPAVEASAASPEVVAPIPAAVSSEAPHLEPIPSMEPAEATLSSEIATPEPATLVVSSNGQATDGYADETSLASAEVMARPPEVTALPVQAAATPTEVEMSSPAEGAVAASASNEAATTEATPTAEAPASALVEQAPAVDAADESTLTVETVDSGTSVDDQPPATETTRRRYQARQERQHVGQSSPTNG